MRDAISWQPVSHLIRATIENWFAAGSSPSEWEVLLQRATNPQRVFVAISLYDLNEESLCDSRAEIVPISQTVRDLISTNADWQFAKRLLTQYPVSFIRLVYPTVGRSDGVLVGLREKAARLMPSAAPALGAVEAPTIVSPDSEIGTVNTETEKLTDWSPARTLRRMALMRIAIKGVTRLDGPKKVSFIRMLRRAQASGQVDVLVLPVSESYRREFVSSEANARFEALLGLARSTAPTAHWYRLDRVPALNSDECYLDFVHLNNRGQEIATALFLQMLSTRDGEVTN